MNRAKTVIITNIIIMGIILYIIIEYILKNGVI